MDRKIRLGVVANELFDPKVGRMGGFGWAVRQVTHCFTEDPVLGVEVVLVMGERPKDRAYVPGMLHGAPVIWRKTSKLAYFAQLRQQRLDALLAIDYRPNYRLAFLALPRTPVLLWVRDPWDKKDVETIRTLRIPSAGDQIPDGCTPPDTASLRQVLSFSRLWRRPFRFAVTSPHLVSKIPECYSVEGQPIGLLPNIVTLSAKEVRKSPSPVVVFLARFGSYQAPVDFRGASEAVPGCSVPLSRAETFQWPRRVESRNGAGECPPPRPRGRN